MTAFCSGVGVGVGFGFGVGQSDADPDPDPVARRELLDLRSLPVGFHLVEACLFRGLAFLQEFAFDVRET